jgi:hypothetical protein
LITNSLTPFPFAFARLNALQAAVTHSHIHLDSDLLKSIQPTANQLCHGAIIKDYIGNNAACKNAQQKLNLYGYLVGHCDVVNSVKNMNRMTVAEIHCKDAADKELKKKNKVYNEKAPESVRSLKREIMMLVN